MSINLTDEIEVKTKKGKLGAAKQIFLEGDTQTVENEIQNINSRHNDLSSKHESLSSTVSEHTNQIESNQSQITANKSAQDEKNVSLDANMAKLNARDDQITELVKGVTATGGASVATAVTYDNEKSGLTAVNAQAAIDEVSSIGHFAKRGGVVNISTNYNSEHTAEVLTLAQALSKVPSTDRVLGFQGKYLATDGWHTIIYIGESLTSWSNTTKWIDLADKVFNSISNNATFAGIAIPTTNPGTPDGPVFYIATEVGIYSNFGDISVADGEAAILEWKDGWTKKTTGFAIQQQISEIEELLLNISWMQGGILANGEFNELNSYFEVTDFIPVYPGLIVDIDVKIDRSNIFNTGYDENQNYVQVLENNGSITIPEGVYFIRINNIKKYETRKINISKVTYANKVDIKKIQNENKQIKSELKLNTDNVFWLNLKDLDVPLSIKSNTALSETDGTTINFSSCYTIDFIDIEQFSVLKLDGVCCGKNKIVALACFYDQDKTFISSIPYSTVGEVVNNILIEKPSNAKYIQIGYNTNNVSGFSEVNVVTSFGLHQNNVLFNKYILNFFLENNLLNVNLSKFFLSTQITNGRLTEDGTMSYGSCYTTDYLELKGQKLLKLENAVCAKNKDTLLACFYDADFAVITGSGVIYPKKGEIIEAIVKVPSNAAYARFSVNNYNISHSGNVNPFGIIDSTELEESINKVGKPYYGKKILSLGDSYTWLNYYGKYLAKATGCTQRGRGQNGNFLKSFANDTYSTSGTEGTTEEPFNADLLSQYDIVTIMGGTNDYGHGGTTLGSLETMKEDGKLGANSKTIYGAVWYLINKILTIKPDMKIFFCTQPFRLPYELGATGPGGYEENANGLSMEKIANAIVEAAGYFGIPVFDFYHCSNWNPWTVRFTNPESPEAGKVVDNIYTYDGLHPKKGDGNGADLLGTAFGMFINNH